MPQVCIRADGICSTNCPNRAICTIPRRSILQHYVATKESRGVYADAIISDVAEKRAEALTPIQDGNARYCIGYRPGKIRINKGML